MLRIFILVVFAAAAAAQDLPSWWKLGIEYRGRAEGYDGLNCLPGSRDYYYLSRFRVTSTVTVRPWMRVVAQVQDSRVAGYDRTPVPATVSNPLNLRLAYAEAGALEGDGWTARVGRQPIVFGDMRIVSTSNWSNVGPAWDAVRLSRKGSRSRLDWFSALGVVPGRGYDRTRMDRKLSGFHGSFDVRKDVVLDSYAFWKSNVANSVNVMTYGMRSTGKLRRGLDYNVEMALQRGHIAHAPMSAWLGHWEAGRTVSAAEKAPRAWLEYNYASGGPGHTFEQLYPSPFSVVGRAADFASRNLHEPMAGMEWRPYAKWKFRGTYRAFWLASGQDKLYLLSGAPFAYEPGASSRRVGEELGGWAIYQATRKLQIWSGFANLWAGPYLKEAGKSSQIRYPYVMWTYNVL